LTPKELEEFKLKPNISLEEYSDWIGFWLEEHGYEVTKEIDSKYNYTDTAKILFKLKEIEES
jgi:hypothetical protein